MPNPVVEPSVKTQLHRRRLFYQRFLRALGLSAGVIGWSLALGIFGYHWIATGKRPLATMASGAVVTPERVTYGKEHRFVYGSLRQQLMSRLPEKWFGRSGASVVTHHTTNDSTVAWLVWKGKPGTLMPMVSIYVVVNDRGQTVSIGES